MIVKVLGSAAGGAFPQWNCSCSNCSRMRKREMRARPRTQSQLAVSSDGVQWHLLNASPDLRSQIEATPELQPDPSQGSRHSPIQCIVLTNADLDHVLGLLLMRESQPLSVYASQSVTRILLEDNSFFGMLRQTASQTQWTAIAPGVPFSLGASGIECQPVQVSDQYPRYVSPARVAELKPEGAVFGMLLSEPSARSRGGKDAPSGKTLGYFPGVGAITPELEKIFAECDVLFVDGTFWDEDELKRVHGNAPGVIKTASQMGHIPQSGEQGILKRLAGLKKPRKIFVHINNTNPILDEASEQHRAVADAGWEIAYDGMEIRL